MSDATERICSRCGFKIGDEFAECPGCDRTEITPEPRIEIPGYRLLGSLGEGGMGQVLLAEDQELGRQVAVKLISVKLAGNEELRERFAREARVMASIEHPNVVRVYSFGRTGEQAYLVMEYVDGESLSSRIRSQGRLDAADALHVVRQTVLGLKAAWARRIVHRDIKPSNVLIAGDGNVRVADFGLAKPLELHGSGDSSLTASGYLLGTPHYVSPEQARGEAVDFRSDVYSVGIMLFEMLTGERPFVGSTPFAVVAKHLNEPLPSLSAKRPDLEPDLVDLVERMTAKEPDERPGSYDEIVSAVDRLQSSQDDTTLRSPVVRATPRRLLGLVRPRYVVAAGVVAVLAMVLWLSDRTFTFGPAAMTDHRLSIVVSPFFGPDSESEKEGQLIGRLIRKEIERQTSPENVALIDAPQGRVPKTDDEARQLASELNASVVIWGEALTARGQTEIAPRFTLRLPERDEEADTFDRDDPALVERFQERGTGAVRSLAAREQGIRLEAVFDDQIALRRSAAENIGDTALLILGSIALELEDSPEKALAFFERATPSSDSLVGRARALLRTRQNVVPSPPPSAVRLAGSRVSDEAGDDLNATALDLLEEARTLDPDSTNVHAAMSDLLWEMGRHESALSHLRAIQESGEPVSVRNALLLNDLVWVPEEGRMEARKEGKPERLPYLLGLDPETWRVVHRIPVPSPIHSIEWSSETGVVIAIGSREREWSRASGIAFRRVPISVEEEGYYPLDDPDPFSRLSSARYGWGTAACFEKSLGTVRRGSIFGKALTEKWTDCPRTIEELESKVHFLRRADPTNPWHTLVIGLIATLNGNTAEAEGEGKRLRETEWPIHYFEYYLMAGHALGNGSMELAEALHEKGLQRRLNRRTVEPVETGGGANERRSDNVRPAYQLSSVDDLLADPDGSERERLDAIASVRPREQVPEEDQLEQRLPFPQPIAIANRIENLVNDSTYRRAAALYEKTAGQADDALTIDGVPRISITDFYGWYERWRDAAGIDQGLEAESLIWEKVLRDSGEPALADSEQEWRKRHLDDLPRTDWSLSHDALLEYALASSVAAIWALLYFAVVSGYQAHVGGWPPSGRRPPVSWWLTAAVALLAVSATSIAVLSFLESSLVGRSSPMPLSDSMGAPQFRRFWDAQIERSRSDEALFLAGVSSQLAGDFENARLYYMRTGHDRARQNREQLVSDVASRTPDAMPRLDDFMEASRSDVSIRALMTFKPMMPELVKGQMMVVRAARHVFLFSLLLGIACFVAAYSARNRQQAVVMSPPMPSIRIRPAFRWFLLHQPVRGYVCAWLGALFVLVTFIPLVLTIAGAAHGAILNPWLQNPFTLTSFDFDGFVPWLCARRPVFIGISVAAPVLWIAFASGVSVKGILGSISSLAGQAQSTHVSFPIVISRLRREIRPRAVLLFCAVLSIPPAVALQVSIMRDISQKESRLSLLQDKLQMGSLTTYVEEVRRFEREKENLERLIETVKASNKKRLSNEGVESLGVVTQRMGEGLKRVHLDEEHLVIEGLTAGERSQEILDLLDEELLSIGWKASERFVEEDVAGTSFMTRYSREGGHE